MKDPTSVLLLLLVLGTKVVPLGYDRMSQDAFIEELKEIGKDLVELEDDLLDFLSEIDEEQSERETLGELNQDDFIEETFAYYVTALEKLKAIRKELVELEEDLLVFMSEIVEEQSEEESVQDPFNPSLPTQGTLEQLITGDGVTTCVVRSRVVSSSYHRLICFTLVLI